MGQLMLVNPRKRGTRTAAQKAATRKLVAYNRGKKSGGRKTAKRRSTSLARVVRRRRNPIAKRDLISRGLAVSKNGAIGSVGAIAGTLVGNYLPIPATFQAGPLGIAMDAIIGIGVGFGVGKFFDKRIGEQMAQGAVTVALHNSMKAALSKALPNIRMDGYSEDLLGYEENLLGMGAYDLSAYDDTGVGFFDDSDEMDGLGYSGAGWTGSESDIEID